MPPGGRLPHHFGIRSPEVCASTEIRGKPPQLRDDALRGAPDADTDEFDGGEVMLRALVVASGDASEVLETVEEAFYKIALPVEPA